MCKVICVTNRKLAGEYFLAQMRQTAASGVHAVILREKDLSEAEYEALAGKLRAICEEEKVPLILHTYVKTAKKLGILRLHLPFQSFMNMCRQEKEVFQEIGVSVHTCEEAVAAWKAGASYITAGHIFLTDCKKGLPPRGLEFLGKVCRSVEIPVYAIGGITPENAASCIKSGAAGVCLMSSLMQTQEPERLMEKINQQVMSVN